MKLLDKSAELRPKSTFLVEVEAQGKLGPHDEVGKGIVNSLTSERNIFEKSSRVIRSLTALFTWDVRMNEGDLLGAGGGRSIVVETERSVQPHQ
jgi:hypothetical protein